MARTALKTALALAALAALAALPSVGAAAPAAPTSPGPDLVLEPRLSVPGPAGPVVRMTQRLHGLEIHGRDLVFAYDPSGALRSVRGEVVVAAPLATEPALDAAAAEAIAEDAAELVWSGAGRLWAPRSELVAYLDRAGAAHLAWRVDVSLADPIGAWRVLVDAHDGSLRDWQPTMHTASADVYPTNPSVSDLVEVELPRLDGDGLELSGEHADVTSCIEFEDTGFGGQQCVEQTRFALPDGDGDYFYAPDADAPEDAFAEVQMYYHLDFVSEWFSANYGFEHAVPIEGIVNFDVTNAFFGDFNGDGRGDVAFGQGGGIDFAYDADVIYHEFMHSVFGTVVQSSFLNSDEYGLEWAPGGLNEGSADAMALALTGDPQLGEYAGAGFGPGNSAIRDLEADRHCPTDLYGQSHTDGEVWGAFAWNLIEDEAVGAEIAADVLYSAIVRFPDNPNWRDAGAALYEALEILRDLDRIDDAQVAAVEAHMEASGLDDCGRVIPLDDDQEPTLLMVHPGFAGDVNIPLGHQFSIDAPEGTYRVRFRIKDFATQTQNLAWVLYVRRGEHVVHELVDSGFGFDVAVPDVYDHAVEGEGEDVEFNLTFDSDPPLEPGETYYFSMASRQLGTIQGFGAAEVRVDGRTWWEEPVAPEDDDDGGAGCRDCSATVVGGAGYAPLAALLLVLLGFAARRRQAGTSSSSSSSSGVSGSSAR